MRRLLAIAVFLLAAFPASATKYYISYSSGSNSNNGTSEATPWKSHPYMQTVAGCAGAAPTYTHTAGDSFTFKMGDSWPNACFDMVIPAGGTSGAVTDLYTYDPAWGSPGGTIGNVGQLVGTYQFNAGGAVINGSDAKNKFIYDNGNNFIVLNGMEFTGMTWTGCPAFGNVEAVDIQTSSNVTLSNSYTHNWTHSGATCDQMKVMVGNANTPFNSASGLTFSVVDGANSGGAGVADSGAATYAIPVCQNNIIRNVSNGCLLNANGVAHDNAIGPVNQDFDYNIGGAGLGTHSNCVEPIDMIGGGYSIVYIYNNYLHDCTQVNVLTQGAAANNGREFDYIWNNVLDVGAVASPPIPLQFDSISTSNSGSQVHAWNNTINGGTGGVCMRTISRGNGNFEVLDIENNHCISDSGLITLGITGNTYTNTTNVTQGTAAAAAQGYAASETYPWQTPNASGATVGTGTNLETIAASQSPSLPYATLANDTTLGGIRPTVVRPPSASWDVGAYQFVAFLTGTFYVDNCSTVGSDTNNGTSAATPWLTVGRVSDSAFTAGSTILFRNGCTWRERLQPPTSGTVGNPITFSTYGTGAAAVISGATLLTGWISGEPTALNYQVTTQTDNAYDNTGYLFLNTTTLGIAQNDTNVRTGGMRFENVAVAQGTTIYSAVFQGNVFPGDQIAVSVYGEAADNALNFTVSNPWPKSRTKTASTVNWSTTASGFQPVTVTSIVQEIVNRAGWTSGNALDILTSSQNAVPLYGRIYTPGAGATAGAKLTVTYVTPQANVYAVPYSWNDAFDAAGPVFFDGVEVAQGVASLAALTGNNEWYYDYANEAPFLYIYSTTNPSGRTIEIADHNRLSALYVDAQSWIAASNLSFQKSRNYNVEIFKASNVTLTNIESTKSGSLGIDVEGDSSNVTISGGSSHDNGGLAPGDNDCIGIGGKGSVGNTPVLITGVDLYNCVNSGIEVYAPASSSTTAVTATYNNIHGNGICNMSVPAVICAGHGFQFDGPGNQAPLVQGNIVSGNAGDGILGQARGTFSIAAYGNTVYGNGQNGVYAQLGTWQFKNNLVLNNDTATGYFEAFVPNTVTSWTSDYNDFYEASGNFMSWSGSATNFSGWKTASSGDAHSISSDPLFTNSGASIFTLTSSSPAIAAGVNLGSVYQQMLLPLSSWPNGVLLGTQAASWTMGAFLPSTSKTHGAGGNFGMGGTAGH